MKYVTRAVITVQDHWGRSHLAGGETVFEEEKKPVNTGLVDANGIPLFRVPEVNPIGFKLG
jgi:hypothetical protein